MYSQYTITEDGRTPLLHCSTGADPAFQLWATGLLGKLVEVFWEQADDGDGQDGSDGDGDGDVTDWYEAKVVSYNPIDGMFGVEFVGDTATVYKMSLGKDQVRPLGRRFEDPAMVTKDRGRYLDSLAKFSAAGNKSAVFELKEDSLPPLDGEKFSSARSRAQTILRRSLLRGMRNMGIDPDTNADAEPFCSIKAWELELAIYQEYGPRGDGAGREKVTAEYRAKVRMLKHNLEDAKNPTLAPRVLVGGGHSGGIGVSDLVKMAPEALASRHAQLKRAKAEEEARRNIVLVPARTRPVAQKKILGKTVDTKGISGPAMVAPSTSALPVSSRKTADMKPLRKKEAQDITQNISMKPAAIQKEDAQDPLPPPNSTTSDSKRAVSSLSSLLQKPPSPPLVSGNNTNNLGTIMMREQAQSQPAFSSGPTTAASLQGREYLSLHAPQLVFSQGGESIPAGTALDQNGRSGRILSSAGGMRFHFSIHGLLRCSFSTSFVQDGPKRYILDHFLPEVMPKEKGRVPGGDEFNRFMSGKLSTGRWMVAILRLVDIHTAEDMAGYKSFYKKYEEHDRIAMFGIEGDGKLFLVTPKFAKAARCLRGVSSLTATYAVILVRARTLKNA